MTLIVDESRENRLTWFFMEKINKIKDENDERNIDGEW